MPDMSERPTTIIGTYISPYVRKVLVCLEIKGVDYRIDPIVPFFGNDEFTRISPTRRIPVLIDDQAILPDSSVICAYLEDRYPNPALFPADPATRGKARWLEEYSDTRLGDVLIWRLFNQLAINPYVWGTSASPETLEKTRSPEIPELLNELETMLTGQGYLLDDICVADIAIAAMFRNASFVRFEIDENRWPITSGFVSRVQSHPAFVKLRPFEELAFRTPVHRQREALIQAGAPVSEETLASAKPRRGIFRV